MGIRSPLGIITSDGGGLVNGTGHPRSVGTFARFLGRYIRDQQVLSWMEGLRRITLLPAQRVEEAMPTMLKKGRLQVGMDADITIFDPATVQERATYADPDQRSAGIAWVIVNGVVAMDHGTGVVGEDIQGVGCAFASSIPTREDSDHAVDTRDRRRDGGLRHA